MTKRKSEGNSRVAVAYVRVSTDEQALGPEAQRKALDVWAAREGVRIVAWRADIGVSGATPVDERPGLLAALDDVRAAGAGVLLVAKRDRLARDVIVAAMVEQLARREGAAVVSAAGEGTGGDSNDPSGLLMRGIVDLFAQYERAVIRARTRSALGVKRARGELVGEAPFGWRRGPDGKVLVRDEREQAVIARACELRRHGLSQRAIGERLAVEGHRSRAGTKLSQQQISRILRSENSTVRKVA